MAVDVRAFTVAGRELTRKVLWIGYDTGIAAAAVKCCELHEKRTLAGAGGMSKFVPLGQMISMTF
jgi:hypothetical protein